ncbi:MAG: hypothetical protein ACFFBP_11565 [Promethearchaeota archaeon]
MKENTKYNDYRFVGKINVDEIQPWFDFASNKPWDDSEIPWVVESKVRREILIKLADGPKTFQQLHDTINFSPRPLLIQNDEYKCNVNYQWKNKTLENHLLILEWNDLIKFDGEKYEITFPIYKMEELMKTDQLIMKFAENWMRIIKEMKNEIDESTKDVKDKITFQALLIERTVEKLYELLKTENILPDKPNLKTLWAEQLRSMKFEEFVSRIF